MGASERAVRELRRQVRELQNIRDFASQRIRALEVVLKDLVYLLEGEGLDTGTLLFA